MIRLASHCPGPGSICCSHLMAVCESAQMWTLVQGCFVHCLLAPRPVRWPCSAISRASPITYSSASNTSLFVPRYMFRIFHSGSHHTTLAPLRLESSLEPSVQNDISPGLLLCLPASCAPSSLSLARGALLPGKVSSYTHSVCSMPAMLLILVLSVIVCACRCSSVFVPLLVALNQSSSPCISYPGWACSSPSGILIRRMSLVGCDLGGPSSLYRYLRCRLLSWKTVS